MGEREFAQKAQSPETPFTHSRPICLFMVLLRSKLCYRPILQNKLIPHFDFFQNPEILESFLDNP